MVRDAAEGRGGGGGGGHSHSRRAKRPSGGRTLEDRESRESKEISSIMGGGLGLVQALADGEDDEELFVINK
jgi:hypothetical protein